MAALLAACLAASTPLSGPMTPEPESKEADSRDNSELKVVQAAVMPGDENGDSVQMPIGQQMVASSSFRKARSNPSRQISTATSIRCSGHNARLRRQVSQPIE